MATATTTLREREATDRQLARPMTTSRLFFLSCSAIIGSGWLFASLAAGALAGPAAIISWIIGGFLVLLVALNYAEISSMMPRSGAIVRYPHLTHGGYTGFIIGWCYLLSAISVPAIEAEAVVLYASSYIHGIVNSSSELTWPWGILFGIGLMLAFFVINYVGIQFLSRFNQYITIWKFLIPTITFVLLFLFGLHTQNYMGYKGGFAPLGWAPVLGAVASSGIVFSYLGFRQGLDFGGEAANPQRSIPIATIMSVVVCTCLYVALEAAFIGAIKWHAFGISPGDFAGLKSGSAAADAPFYIALKAAGPALLGGFATVLLVDAFISPGATGYVYLGTSARTVYGLTMNGYFPDALKWIVSRFRIPWLALIVSFVGGCIFFLPLPSWYELVGIITSATVLTYIMGPIGLPAFRNLAPNLHRPFKLPYAEIVGPAGFIGAVLIVYWSGFTTLAIVVAAVFVALPVFVWFYAPNKGWISPAAGWILGIVFLALWLIVQRWGQWALVAKPTTVAHPQFAVFYFVSILMVAGFTGIFYYLCNDEGKIAVRASWWLIYFILAVYAISYYGVFGPLKTPGIPFPVDLLMVMMVALTAYGWAVMSAYQTEELKEILDSGSGLVQDDAPTRAAPTTPPPSISPQPGFGD